MGLFSRKDKNRTSKSANSPLKPLFTSQSTASFESMGSIKSPNLSSQQHLSQYSTHTYTGRPVNRSSSGTAITATSSVSNPGTPLTPFSPVMAKIDLPRGPDPAQDPAGYLRSLQAVRERTRIISDKALRNELNHFDVDMSKFADVVTFVTQIIKRDYDLPYSTTIPPHGRYQQFSVGGRDRLALLLTTWPIESVDSRERCRRLVDLFWVSVLLDAGAGTEWKYTSTENRRMYRRSEGLAIASLEMFKSGLFSSNPQNKTQVDQNGLRALTVEEVAKAMQSRPGNAISGLQGRADSLIRLGDALAANPEVFGADGRPGNMVDFLLSHPTTQASAMPIVHLPVLWDLLMNTLEKTWPNCRTTIDGIPLGDAWPCSSMPAATKSSDNTGRASPSAPTFSAFPTSSGSSGKSRQHVDAWESIVPLHKPAQWLTYSLVHLMQTLLRINFAGIELLTGLPEYRNGGLFIDLGVLTLKEHDEERGLAHFRDFCGRMGSNGIEVAPMFYPGDDVVVEWRAVTVGFLDRLCKEVNRALQPELQGQELSLAQLLEGGSWKGGREMAEMSRPNTKEPPILIESDGTVF